MDSQSAPPNPLTLLLELGRAFHSTLELDPLLGSILKQIQSALQCEGGSIWLFDDGQTVLTCTHAVGPHYEEVLKRTMPGHIIGPLLHKNPDKALRVDDPAHPGELEDLTRNLRANTRNLMVATLLARGELLGTVSVINKLGAPAFSEDDAAMLTALAGHAGVAIHNAQLYEQHHRNLERRVLLDQIGRHLQQTLDIDLLIPRIFEEVNKAIQAEGQTIWLLNAETGMIYCRFAVGPSTEELKNLSVPIGKGIVGATVEKQESLLIADAQNDPRLFRSADAKTGLVTRSLMSVPMVREGRSIGAIQAVNKISGGFFTHDDLDLLRSIADSAALAIENARLFTELQASYDNTLDALAAALDLRDRETEGHSRRVVEYTARLAVQINMPTEEIYSIRRGALIHDIGKIGVPDAVLHKPGPLDPEERKIIERHPQAGYEMLVGIPYLQEEIKIVLAHQERWDGAGYPYNLKGKAIPLGARLFAIADTFDALTSDRPYRKGRPYEIARQIIAEEAGKQFDPLAVEAFLAVPSEEWLQIRGLVMDEVVKRRAMHAARVRRGTGMLNPALLDRLPPLPSPTA